MIKFFRKIRQKLLSENKFSKYLIYAIGEIFLVVIGILIALYVNNWNQKKADIRKEKALFEQFIFDLEKEGLKIKENLNLSKEKGKIAQYYFNKANNIESSIDTINLNNFTAGIRIPISFKSKNQKFVDQINDKDLYNILIEYMYVEESYLDGLTWTNGFIRNKARNYLGTNKAFNLNAVFGEKPIKEVFSESGLMHDTEKFQKLYIDGEFENILFTSRMQSYTNINAASMLLEKNKNLIKERKKRIK